MPSKIKIGILGCSSIADRSVIPAIQASDLFELTAIGSRSKEKGEAFSQKFQCGSCSYDSLLENNDIDAVYVSLPTGLHHEWGMKTIQSGKHLLMEKTFTDTYMNAREIISLAGSKNLVAMEALMYVYHPMYQTVISLINDGSIGILRHLEASFGFPYLPADNIRHDRNLGGGAILDTLVYPLSFCMNTCGEDYNSLSYNTVFHDAHEIDARGFVKIDWNDYSAFINYGFGFAYRNICSAWGDQGHLSAEQIFTKQADYEGKILIKRQDKTEEVAVSAANHFELMIDDFYQKIVNQSPSLLNEKDNILGRMKIISEIYKKTYKPHKTGDRSALDLSIVIPVYCSKKIIENTVKEIEAAVSDWCDFEIILVDDGSADGTLDVINQLAAVSKHIKAFSLLKNFGQHNAIMAGLHKVSGKCIVIMDDDGQHDPSYIRHMTDKINKGYDAVYVKYDKKFYGFLKNLGSRLNDAMSTSLLKKPPDLYLSSFKAITRDMSRQIIKYTGPYPYIDGIIFSTTSRVTSIPAKHRGTDKSASTYSFQKLILHWLNMFTNFSIKPLRLIFSLGCLIGSGSLGMLIGLTYMRITDSSYAPPGWTMLAILILCFGSIQLLCLGLIGEYIGRVLLLINKRPQFVMRNKADHEE